MPTGLQIDRLSVADLGGAAFSASGRIVTRAVVAARQHRVDLDAPDMTPPIAAAGRDSRRKTAQALVTRADRWRRPLKLHAALDVAADKSDAALTVAQLA